MTTTAAEMPLPRVELEADDVHVLITAWGTATVGDRAPDGTVMLYREQWDADSFEPVTATRTRLLVAHDAARAVGVLTTIKPTDAGLEGWGRLVGSTSAKAHTRELVREGLHSAASVAFTPNNDHDIWTRPTTRNGLPTVTRRGARVREASLVWQGAVPGSRVLEIAKPPTPPPVNPILDEADRVVHGGYGARFILDKQIADHQEQERRREILAEADRLAAAGERWQQYVQPADIGTTEPSPRIRSIIDAQHGMHRAAATWDQRMAELLDHRPRDQRGWDRWQREYDRLMREKYPT
ncbi:hypothetical protein [Cellulomonas xylanilytica]|uniref:Uncharacterized protein n=1 Tax=Cellulomonas xylanilytica TaxID=233583 RepID=A0A510V278_9CELL|nr:hypothetical protein [Cellulomonas xylanilytica]GEK20994.1 hypothetical protein CXY01_15140 [Cellulomonas xylanilytica]